MTWHTDYTTPGWTEPTPINCRCPEGAYLGAQLVGTPTRCERCRGLVDEEAAALLSRLYAEQLAELRAKQETTHADDEVCQLPTCSRCAWRGVGYMSERGVTRDNPRKAEASWSLPPCGHLECADYPLLQCVFPETLEP